MVGRIPVLFVAVACSLLLQACRSVDTPAQDQPSQEPAYHCIRAVGAITVDGKLDEPDWETAEVVSRFYPYAPTTEPALSPTRVRMLWDAQHLYVGFECEDDDVWSFSDRDDAELWHGDVIELFIKTDTHGLTYKEFVIAPSGALFDAEHASRGGGGYRRFKGWSSGATVATTLDGTDGDWHDSDRSYTVELAIPLDALSAIRPKTEETAWTFGVFRYNYSKSFEEPQMLMSIPESLKWGFHYYPGYRPMRFDRHISND